MISSNSERFHDALARTQWDEAAALFQSFLPEDAAAILRQLSFEKQQPLFRRLALDTAAILLPRLPYYDQYVLLHSRTREDMRALVDKIDPDDRMRFFDELPEEAWQRLMDELAADEGTARSETSEAIPTNSPVPTTPGISRSSRSSRTGLRISLTPQSRIKFDAAANLVRTYTTHPRHRALARSAGRGQSQCGNRFPEFCALSLADGPGKRRGATDRTRHRAPDTAPAGVEVDCHGWTRRI